MIRFLGAVTGNSVVITGAIDSTPSGSAMQITHDEKTITVTSERDRSAQRRRTNDVTYPTASPAPRPAPSTPMASGTSRKRIVRSVTIDRAPSGLSGRLVRYSITSVRSLADYFDGYDPTSAVDLPTSYVLPHIAAPPLRGAIGEVCTDRIASMTARASPDWRVRLRFVILRWLTTDELPVAVAMIGMYEMTPDDGVGPGRYQLRSCISLSDITASPTVAVPRMMSTQDPYPEAVALLETYPIPMRDRPLEWDTDVEMTVEMGAGTPTAQDWRFMSLRDLVERCDE